MNPQASPIIGIDLGTTNSVVAALIDGKVQVISENGESILPSIVGIGSDGKLLVGQSAKNQLAAFPDRTISSVKRKMGQAVRLKLADQEFTPQEISAVILRRLRHIAEQALGMEVTRAVITVPAFFDENQRQATREAGQLAGFTVERIINEPTAASLVYHVGSHDRKHLIVYDLGGGTFDVSIVRIEAGVVEVLSSKGDTQLGGDDFDQLLAKYVAEKFRSQYKIDLMEQSTTRWRLLQACERAKCELSTFSVVRIAEEFITTIDGNPVHLDLEVERHEYEELIAVLVERTIGCVDEAIRDSGLVLSEIDELILVGGSTRTPLVRRRLQEDFQRDPKWSVNPDLAVALGAATQAAMQSGFDVGPVLIDIASHTLGIEALSSKEFGSELQFVPILRRNVPLPAKYEEVFFKVFPEQVKVEIHVYQGESTQLSHNRSLGSFMLDLDQGKKDADRFDRGEILVRFELNLDGILVVTAIERTSGSSKTLKIDNAFSRMESKSKTSENRMETMFEQLEKMEGAKKWVLLQESNKKSDDVQDVNSDLESHSSKTVEADGFHRIDPPAAGTPASKLSQLLEKAKSLRSTIDGEDANDVDRLIAEIASAQESNQSARLSELETELDDLLFYINE